MHQWPLAMQCPVKHTTQSQYYRSVTAINGRTNKHLHAFVQDAGRHEIANHHLIRWFFSQPRACLGMMRVCWHLSARAWKEEDKQVATDGSAAACTRRVLLVPDVHAQVNHMLSPI
jgi:hypothetical protein